MAEEGVKGIIDWVSMYKGRMQGGMTWMSALSELVDNSLDANADAIEVAFISGKTKVFTISDNGNGSPSLDPFFGFGVHRNHVGGRSDALGIYGVGGTHSVLYISSDLKSQVTISTKTKTEERSVSAKWGKLAEAFNAGKVAPGAKVGNDTGRTGTKIQLSGPLRQMPYGEDLKRLTRNLSFRYSKAIENDAKLYLTRGSQALMLQPYKLPELTDVIRDTFEVNGKGVEIVVGIVPPGGQVARAGLHYRYSYRVVRESSDDGCGNYGTSKIFGFVDLAKKWCLDLHKDRITDKDAKQLYAEVFRRIEPLLQRAQNQVMSAESRELIATVERRLNDAVNKTRKGRRPGKRGKRGTQKPTGEGAGHTDAENKQPGSTMDGPGERGRGGSLHIDFIDFAALDLDSAMIGDFRGNTVRLNTACDVVPKLRRGNADAIFITAMFVYFMYKGADRTPLEFSFVSSVLRGVGVACSGSSAPALDGKRAFSSPPGEDAA